MGGANERVQALAEELAPELLNYFARRVTPTTDAADLLSDTLLVICRRAKHLPGDDQQARLWAFGVARKVLAGQRRSTKRRSALVTRLQEELQQADGLGHQVRSVEDLHAALATLDPLDQEIIRLVHWEGFSQAEVAQILDRPAGTIRSRYARARSALRSELGYLSSQDR
jgi:RNA polymerase sigma-70 factor (ECF subfamily)